MSSHARLSPSGAHRWMQCPGSVELETNFPDGGSEYAAEGTAAHSLAEVALIRQSSAETTIKEVSGEWDDYDAEDMARHVQTYIDVVANRPGNHFVEVPVDISPWTDEENARGTADHIAIAGDTMYVDDLKYGQGVKVNAQDNPQGMLYALGALESFGFLYEVEHVQIGIIQPRLDHVSEWTISVADLLEFGEAVKEAAARCNAPDADLVPSDSACKFCRAKVRCRARAEANLAAAKTRFGDMPDPKLLSNEEVAEILPKLSDLADWSKGLHAYAEAEALAGRDIPGFKLVAGRSVRQWIDADKAAKALRSAKVKVADLYTKKIIGIGAAEKLLGRGHPAIEKNVHKPPGKPALVPESDKRPPMNPAASAAAAFDDPTVPVKE